MGKPISSGDVHKGEKFLLFQREPPLFGTEQGGFQPAEIIPQHDGMFPQGEALFYPLPKRVCTGLRIHRESRRFGLCACGNDNFIVSMGLQ